MKPKRLSIITPTFNRAYILEKLYKSLCNQTVLDFEWVIVDDGSTDDTQSVIEMWKRNYEFDIHYVFQENGGKHRAVNNGVKFASYEYVYIVDSDDYLLDFAVERIYSWIESIEGLINYAGVSGLRGYNLDQVIGQFPEKVDYIDSTNMERRKYKLSGDKAEVYKKMLLEKYPFPEFDGEKFLPENAVWNKISLEGYKLRWFGEIIHICNYLDDGLTKKNGDETVLANFKGYSYVEKINIKGLSFPYNYLAIGRYSKRAFKKGLTRQEITRNMEITNIDYLIGRVIDSINIKYKMVIK